MAHPHRAAPAETLTGTRTLTLAEVTKYLIWTFDPGGAARTLNLPAAATCPGHELRVANTADAAEVLTIAADSVTIVTPTQGESAVLWCDGTLWRGIAGANS